VLGPGCDWIPVPEIHAMPAGRGRGVPPCRPRPCAGAPAGGSCHGAAISGDPLIAAAVAAIMLFTKLRRLRAFMLRSLEGRVPGETHPIP